MNVANRLTVLRFVLTGVFLLAVFCGLRFGLSVGLVVFVLAGLTDLWDGRIARRDGLVTSFGVLMDPLADKVLVCSAFIAFVGLGWVAAWMAVVVVARELAVTGLRLLAASRGLVLGAEGFGKHKTLSQVVAVVSLLVWGCYVEWGVFGEVLFGGLLWGEVWVFWFSRGVLWLAVVLTCFSGWVYLWRNRGLFLEDR